MTTAMNDRDGGAEEDDDVHDDGCNDVDDEDDEDDDGNDGDNDWGSDEG